MSSTPRAERAGPPAKWVPIDDTALAAKLWDRRTDMLAAPA
jgi:hypothetical protein